MKLDDAGVPVRAKHFYYKINQTDLGPLEGDEIEAKSFLNDVVDFKINYTLIQTFPYIYEENIECNEYRITQKYSFASRAHFVVDLDIEDTMCTSDILLNNQNSISWIDNFVKRLLWIHVLVLILACSSLYFTFHSMYTFIKLYMIAKNRAKKKREEQRQKTVSSSGSSSSEDSIYFNPLFESESSTDDDEFNLHGRRRVRETEVDGSKRKTEPKKHFLFLQFWSMFIIIGNFLQILGACLALNNSTEVTTVIAIMVGSGCLFACISVGKYIEYNKDYSTIYETLRRSFPVVVRYLIGVFPIFLGFLFFGICAFWKSERFSSTSMASYSLFSMIQGDAIFDNLTNLSGVNFFLGQIYCYIFCITFIIIVWNIFISIIEEAYVVTKVKNKTSWIYNYVELEPKLIEMKIHSKPSLQLTAKYFEKMDKSSALLKRRISRSLRSNEIFSGKSKDTDSLEERSNHIHPKIKKRTHTHSHVPRSHFAKHTYKEITESIPEIDEFNLRKDSNLNVEDNKKAHVEIAVNDREKMIEEYFNKIESKFENIAQLTKNIQRKSRLTDSKKIVIFNRINTIENKAKDLRQVWMRNY